jgi:hypothetical protein
LAAGTTKIKKKRKVMVQLELMPAKVDKAMEMEMTKETKSVTWKKATTSFMFSSNQQKTLC